MKKTVCVLFGGVSSEHDVSLQTASSILTNIDRELFEVLPVGITREGKWLLCDCSIDDILAGNWQNCGIPCFLSPSRGDGLVYFENDAQISLHIDCVFPALHGENGEDGTIQGLCALAGLPCVGAGVGGSAVSIDKGTAKAVIDRAGIRQAEYIIVTATDFADNCDMALDICEKKFGYPVFVKPSGTGSSVGVSKAKNRDALKTAIIDALKYDNHILVEEFFDGREIEVAILGNARPGASCCGEIIPGDEFYTYDDKYINGVSKSQIPADLPAEVTEKVRSWAVDVYKAVRCRGLARVDFFVNRETNEVCFNEINTLPGFTSISMYPKLIAHGGMTYSALITRLIELALEA